MRPLLLAFALLASFSTPLTAQTPDEEALRIARIQYDGGGDWYDSPSAIPNLVTFSRDQFPITLSTEQQVVRLDRDPLGVYPMLFLTGHGNVDFREAERTALRRYLEQGGFLWVDDDYGLDESIRPILNSLIPDVELQTVPPDHPIYRSPFEMEEGRPPKVHEHDGEDPEGLGLFLDGRLAVLYTYESNPSDGWAHDEHENPQEVVDAALQFGTNVLIYIFTSLE
ncbi:MAG: DUF4159 domain-containing protein [Bacteroidota bacterium]